MDATDFGLIDIHLYHGGKFIGENEYFGGKMKLLGDVNISSISFYELEGVLNTMSYNSVRRWGFIGNNKMDKFIFFYGEVGWRDNFYHFINFVKKELKIYCECITADLIEPYDNGGDDGVHVVEQPVNVEEELVHAHVVDEDEHEEDDFEGDFNLIDEDSDISDGMEDEDFSSDEEFLQVWKKKRDEKRKNVGGQQRVNLLDVSRTQDKDLSFDDEFIQPRKKIRDARRTSVGAQQRVNLLDVSSTQDPQNDMGYISEYESSDSSPASLDSDDEISLSKRKKKSKLHRYDKTCDPKSLKFEIGMSFKDFDECKDAIKMWAIVNGYNIWWNKSDKKCKIGARCEGDCPWRIYASKLVGETTFVIKTFISPDPHMCIKTRRNRQADCNWLAKVIMNALKRSPNYPAKEMIKDVQLKYDVIVKAKLCYAAKWEALKLLRGTYESHYSKLRSYIAELQRADKEGTFQLKTWLDEHDRPIFLRCYIGFSALKKGFFLGCRKCIYFDACFLKTILGGALVSAIAKDCNDKMFPISWAVVETENEEAWTWFFEKLFEDLGISDGFDWTFMSDKHKGIINGIRKLAPNAEHRHCAMHIYANWRKKFGGPKFKEIFWQAVKSTNEVQFKEKMLDLQEVSEEAYEAFMVQIPSKFCKSLINPYTKTDCVDNNICETFNSYILHSRDKPIIEMLECIRKNLMTRMHDVLNSLNSRTDLLTPNIGKRLNKLQNGVKYCSLEPAVGDKYEVSVCDDTYIVDLPQRECTCRYWMLTGLPCSHALACIFHIRDDLHRYVDEFYHRKNCVDTYKHGLSPILGHKEWPAVVEPPILPPGRPKKNRRKDSGEIANQGQQKLRKFGVRMSCKNCGQFGHNKRTCKVVEQVVPKPKGKAGRPRMPKPITMQQVIQKETRQASSSNRVPKPVRMRQLVQREIRQASQGFGIMHGESGNIYISSRGNKQANIITGTTQVGERNSQSSKVVDGGRSKRS